MQLDPSLFVGRTHYEFGPGAPGQLRPASRASLSSRARNRGGPHHRRGSSGRSRSRLTSSSTSSRRTRAWPEGRRLAIGSKPNLIHRSTVDRWTPTRRAASPVVSSSSSATTASVACTAFFGLAACYECSECYDLSRVASVVEGAGLSTDLAGPGGRPPEVSKTRRMPCRSFTPGRS
jgi:hypothetical protein